MAKSIKTYLEVIVAPDFTTDAIEYLSNKKVRLIKPKEYTPYVLMFLIVFIKKNLPIFYSVIRVK